MFVYTYMHARMYVCVSVCSYAHVYYSVCFNSYFLNTMVLVYLTILSFVVYVCVCVYMYVCRYDSVYARVLLLLLKYLFKHIINNNNSIMWIYNVCECVCQYVCVCVCACVFMCRYILDVVLLEYNGNSECDNTTPIPEVETLNSSRFRADSE